MFDGQPPAIAGELFVSIHEGEWRCTSAEARDDTIGVYVTITRRVAFVPQDRGRIPLLDAADAVDVWADKIASKVHSNYVIMNAANTVLGGSVNGFIEPLRFKGTMGPSQERGPEWFSSAEESDAPVGVSRTLIFAEARRYQTIESQA